MVQRNNLPGPMRSLHTIRHADGTGIIKMTLDKVVEARSGQNHSIVISYADENALVPSYTGLEDGGASYA